MIDKWEGGCITDADRKMLSGNIPEWEAAQWREDMFGIKLPSSLLEKMRREFSGDRYVSGGNPYFPEWREKLPSGSEASWRRGTWVGPEAATYEDRWTDLWIECKAARERDLEESR